MYQRGLATAEAIRAGSEADTVVFSLSSEEPYLRSEGYEILDHSAGAVDLTFINSGNAPLLDNHNRWDGLSAQIGVVTKAWLDAKRLYVEVRFSLRQTAQDIMRDVKAGIIRNVSVGYEISEILRETNDSYRVTKWKPKEASFVTIPADPTVGMGRSDDNMEYVMPPEVAATLPPVPAVAASAAAPVATAETRGAEIAESIVEINALAASHGQRDLADTFIATAMRAGNVPSLAAFRGQLRGVLPADVPLVNRNVGLSNRETRQFSVLRLARAMSDGATDDDIRRAAFEREACEAAARTAEGPTRGYRLPPELMNNWSDFEVDGVRSSNMQVRAPLSTDVNTQVQDVEHIGSRFIDNLRNQSSVLQAGVTVLAGLDSNVEIPGGSANAAGAWLAAEDANAAETNPTFRKVMLSIKDVAGYTDMTRRMIMQSSIDVEAYVRAQLVTGLVEAIDLAGLSGSGATGIPLGIKGTAGIGSISYAAVGALPTWAEIVQFETLVAGANALRGNPAYLMPSSMRGYLKSTEKSSTSGKYMMESNEAGLNGYRALVSNQVAAADMYFGNFADLLMGMWGSLDLERDTAAKFLSGGVRIRAIQSVDFAVARVGSFVLGN